MSFKGFENRAIALSEEQMQQMLSSKGMSSLDELTPSNLRLKKTLELPSEALNEQEYSYLLQALCSSNTPYRSLIGMGYYRTLTPEVILRAVVENPFSFKAEAMDNFHAMVRSLTGMDFSYAKSDLAQAASDALELMYARRKNAQSKILFVDQNIYPYILDVLLSYCEPLGIEIVQDDFQSYEFCGQEFGAFVQYPSLGNCKDFSERVHQNSAEITAICDLLSLCIYSAPNSWGADYAIGSSQRMGLAMAYGGHTSAYLSSNKQVNTSSEKYNKNSIAAGFYAIYYGAEQLKALALNIQNQALKLYATLKSLSPELVCSCNFDTLELEIDAAVVNQAALERGINFCYPNQQCVRLSLDECCSDAEVYEIVEIFALALGKRSPKSLKQAEPLDETMLRKDDILTSEVFKNYHSEHKLLQYIKQLETSQIEISCIESSKAMSLNELREVHPFAPINQAEGYTEFLDSLEADFCAITQLDVCSLQATNFEQGEFSSLMTTRAYYQSKGQFYRDLVLIREDYNPAQILKSGMRIETYNSANLEQIIEQNADELCMVIADLDSDINLREIIELAQDAQAQVMTYTKNMDALVGLISAGNLGADICCFNFQQSRGVVCVKDSLADFLPTHCMVECGGEQGITAISASAYGDAMAHCQSYGYVRLMGEHGLKRAAQCAQLLKN